MLPNLVSHQVLTLNGGVRLMSLTKWTISIYQGFCVYDCAIVSGPTTRCSKITAAPEDEDRSADRNRFTGIFLLLNG